MPDPRDWRRVRALMTDGLRVAAQKGHTIVSEESLIDWVNSLDLVDPVGISSALLKG